MILKDLSVFTNDGRFIENGAILIEGEEITGVYDSPEDVPVRDEALSLPGHVAIPGLVNAHTHIYSALSRGMPLSGYSPRSFTEILEQLWWKLDRRLGLEDVEISAYVAAIESLKSGVTTLIDHHSSPFSIRGSLDCIADAVNSLGMRCSTCYEISDRDGEEARDEGIAENVDFISSPSSFRKGLIGLHASFTVSDETLRILSNLDNDLTPIHVHVAEGPEDQEKTMALNGCRVVERLDRWGLLRKDSVLAHCIHIDQNETTLIENNEAVVVVNPQSNMNNAVGFAGWKGLLEKGIDVGLGNDGFGFNLAHDARSLVLLPHLLKRNVNITSPDDLCQTFLRVNYELASRLFGVPLGKIREGYKADISILEYNSPTDIDHQNFCQHFFFGMIDRLSVREVFVSGKHVLRNGRLAAIEEKDIYEAARKISRKLWLRLEEEV